MKLGNSPGSRIKEFARQKFGSVSGLERAMGMKLNSLSMYASDKILPGAVLQKRLSDVGCDVGYIMTGRRGDVATDENPARIYYDMPGYLPKDHAALFKKLIEKVGLVSKNDIDAAQKIITMIDVMFAAKATEPEKPKQKKPRHVDQPARQVPIFDDSIDEKKVHKEAFEKLKVHSK